MNCDDYEDRELARLEWEHDNRNAPLATRADAVREWVWNAGRERPDTEWLVTSYDTIERNPHYVGPRTVHPELRDHEDELLDYDEAEHVSAGSDDPYADDIEF